MSKEASNSLKLVLDEKALLDKNKSCVSCKKSFGQDRFHRNQSRQGGFESICKKCVSKNKAHAYAKKTKKTRSIARGESGCLSVSVSGDLSDEAILNFAKVYEEIYRGLRYEGKI